MIIVIPLLFSYGTLRDPAVQRATFGRLLAGREDHLPGYVLDRLEITDPAVVAVSGQAHHPVLRYTGGAADRVPGMVSRSPRMSWPPLTVTRWTTGGCRSGWPPGWMRGRTWARTSGTTC